MDSLRFKLAVAFALVVLSFLLDSTAASLLISLQDPSAHAVAAFVSFAFPLVAVMVPAAMLIMRRKQHHLPALFISVIVAFSASYFLKFIFRQERPGGIERLIFFTGVPDYSLPSTHASVAFAPAYVLEKEGLASIGFSVGILTALSRVYLGMHSLSDVVVGSAVAYFMGLYFVESSRFDARKDLFEVRRQVFHLAFGASIAMLVHFGLVSPSMLALLLASGVLLSLASRKFSLPLISRLLDFFEREDERRSFPGRGAIFLVAGSLVSVLLFPADIAVASIMILAFGDSFSHVIGRFFGRTRQPFSVKLLEGTFAGIMFGFLAAAFFVPVHEALIAASAAMILEPVEIRLHRHVIDDNLVVPLVAGAAVVALRFFF